MSKNLFSELGVLQFIDGGSLLPHIKTYALKLLDENYAKSTIQEKIRFTANFSRWLEQQKITPRDLSETAIDNFLKYRKKHFSYSHANKETLQRFREHLQNIGITPISVTVKKTSLQIIENDFKEYLLQERGLAKITAEGHAYLTRYFLNASFGTNPINLGQLSPTDVTNFFLEHAQKVSRGYAKRMVTTLRGFFRYLRIRGKITIDLDASIPPPPKWKSQELPKFLEQNQVEALLKSCNQSTSIGQRDYAILLFLARLGLRASEVVAMMLDDIDWEVGEVIVRGKGSQWERLPIPHDVGKALANYLRNGRPENKTRRVFVRQRAPYRGFASSHAICEIVRQAIKRSKTQTVRKGSHLLRHSLANQMLRCGASMLEIGEVLRHHSPQTTEIYIKVDIEALKPLGLPWPGDEL